jgi:hypothetical protein
MLVLLLLSLELNISPNPLEGKVGEKIPFTVRVLDREGKRIEGNLSFSIVPSSLGQIQGDFFIARKKGRGVLKCKSKVNGKYATGFAYIKIGSRESAKILPPSAVLKKGEQIKFKITGGKAKEWKCIPNRIGNIRDGIFTAENSGRGRVIAILTSGEIKTAFIRVSGVINDIQITPRFKRMKTGEKVQFQVKGNEKVTWILEGKNIGEINSSGIFTAKIPGKAVIIAEKGKREGRAIVVVSGEVGLRIIPKSVTLKTGERTHFRVNAEGFGNINIPINWKVIPERCGHVRKDGTFIAGKIPAKGRVIAVLPKRFGKAAVSANVYITSEKIKPLEITPSFKHFTDEDIDKEFTFKVIGPQKIALQWRVIPEDLGSINNNGIFIPRRTGAGVLTVEPKANINIRPARAFVIIGKDRYPQEGIYAFGDTEPASTTVFINFAFPARKVIEGFKIPLTLKKKPANYSVTWKVMPPDAGKIILNREFQANKLPEGVDQRIVKVFAILQKGRKIVAWTSKDITVIKANQ